MKKKSLWFTIVELVIVITILVILSAISFIEYTNTLLDARNSTRISDMWNLKISLKNHKLKNGLYPIPWNSFDITNSWTIIKQWLLNQDVYSMEIDKKPTDPLIKGQYYFYSTTFNKLFFQIAMSIEIDDDTNENGLIAYVDWDYQTLNDNFVPSLIFATNNSWPLNTLSWASIVDKWTLNLPYDKLWELVNFSTNLNEVLAEPWINILKFYWYSSCEEIYENEVSMWSWSYNILDSNWDVVSTNCDMNY